MNNEVCSNTRLAKRDGDDGRPNVRTTNFYRWLNASFGHFGSELRRHTLEWWSENLVVENIWSQYVLVSMKRTLEVFLWSQCIESVATINEKSSSFYALDECNWSRHISFHQCLMSGAHRTTAICPRVVVFMLLINSCANFTYYYHERRRLFAISPIFLHILR